MGDCMSKSKDSAVLKHFFKNVIFNVVPLEEAGLEAVPLNCQLLSYMQNTVLQILKLRYSGIPIFHFCT